MTGGIETPIARRRFLRLTVGGLAAACSGCSAFDLANAFVPRDTYDATTGIAYGEHERQRLDIYRPASTRDRAPVVVFFYGGNWNMGERGNYRFVAEALASHGIVTVIPDYRLYPDVRFPDFLYDCAAAVRWTIDHAAENGGDAKRVFLMGHSAGAYNAAMLALNDEYLQRAHVDRSSIKGLIGLAGPYDFLPLTGPITKAVFGYPDTSMQTQPITFASKGDPPALLIHGSADDVVEPGNAVRLAAKLRANGVGVREIVYPGVGHVRLIGAMARPLRGSPPVLEDVAGYILRGA
jgi:acetyl esterase/lipase